MRGLSGAVAMVVGAGSGIGRATALRLTEEGARVATVDLRHPEPVGLALQADATSPADMDWAVARAVDELGGLDILVNSVARAPRRTMYEITPQEWRDTLDGSLFSYFVATRAALPRLVARGNGRIVNVCSVTAHVGAQLPAYTAAKGAVLAWSREIAVEFAHHGITVNTVSPGVIETPLNTAVLSDQDVRRTMLDAIPLGRLGTPEDVAGTIAFLASADAGFLSGTDVVVDGAMTAGAAWGTARDAWRTADLTRSAPPASPQTDP